MKKLMNLRVNSKIFLAFSCLFFCFIAIAALFGTLNVIGICYSGVTEITEVNGVKTAVYEYYADGERYTYTAPAEDADLLTPQSETVFYFREYPSVRTDTAAEFFVYPFAAAVLALFFALIFRQGLEALDENSGRLGDYIIPVILTVVSLIFIWRNVTEACGLYTGFLSAAVNYEGSIRAVSKSLMLINANLLIWGAWAKFTEKCKKKSDNG